MARSPAVEAPTRLGRPPKVDAHGTPTRERLLDAAAAACVEHGYDGLTLAEVARRADVSTPAIYGHFAGKDDLLVAASRRALDRIRERDEEVSDEPAALVARWTDPAHRATRQLTVELHLASTRSPELAALLAEWHRENAAAQSALTGLTLPQVKVLYLLLLGLSHQEQIGLDVSRSELDAEMRRLVEAWLDT